MRIKILTYALLISSLSLLVANASAQDSPTPRSEENARFDSLVQAHDERELQRKTDRADKQQKKDDSNELYDLKSERNETKAKAKEARRVERDANDAARESRNAYRSEKKAQKARKQADNQAKKAEDARTISDGN